MNNPNSNLLISRLVCVLLGIVVSSLYFFIIASHDSELGNLKSENAYYNLLIKGFIKGQLSLDAKAPEGLKLLNDKYNPIDNAVYRGGLYVEQPQRMHDMSYYKGKLYLYFSVIPAVVLFLPYHLLTNSYMTHQEGVFVFCSLAYFAFLYIFFKVRIKILNDSSIFIFVISSLAVGFGSGLPMILCRPDLWEVPIMSGYAFLTIAICLVTYLITADKYIDMILPIANISCLLAIGSRPNLLIAYLAISIFIYRLILTPRRLGLYRIVLTYLIPTICIVLILAFYNYQRFDNFFEFGQHYQLAGDRQSESHFNLRYLVYNFYFYFLSNPEFFSKSAFVSSVTLPTLPVGHAVVDSYASVFVSMPFSLFILILPFSLKIIKNPAFKSICTILTVIFLVSAFVTCLFYGTCVRYELDFAPYLFLLAACGALSCDHLLKNKVLYRLIFRIFCTSIVLISISSNLLFAAHWKAKKYYDQSQAYIRMGRIDKAKLLMEKAQYLDSRLEKETDFQNTLGIIYYNIGNIKEAEIVFSKAFEKNPENIVYLTNFAHALIVNGKIDQARVILKKAIGTNPNSSEVKNLLISLK